MYLIVGANGFLGSYMIQSVLRNTEEKILAVSRDLTAVSQDMKTERICWESLDICNFTAVDQFFLQLGDTSELKIIYLAAYHNPDLVEKNPQTAWHTNITSLSYFMNKAGKVRAFFYPSSDSVYGNSIEGVSFKEGDALHPVNTYGRQKALAEQVVIAYGYNVVRYPFLIGPSLLGKKKHFYDVIVEKLQSKEGMEMFSDSYRSTISFRQAADLLVMLIEQEKTEHSIMNVCADNSLSKYDVGVLIAEKLGVDKDLVHPIKVAQSKGIFTAKRADSTIMDNRLLKETLGFTSIKLELGEE